jgi:glycosyltransferase involved in cell wall biosynthesis
VLKPDFGVHGGFERVVEHVESTLRDDGHDVTRLTVDVNALPHSPFGVPVAPNEWAVEPEFFRYLASVEAFDRLDTRRYDAVVSTQPPSFTHRHPRHLALFFHHHRIFYDLEGPYLAAGLAADPALHERASELVRQIDRPRLDQISWFLAGSSRVAQRLSDFNHRTNVSVYHAGIGSGLETTSAPDDAPAGAVLCVGRHEFPKRTELVVHAAHLLPAVQFALVGTGGREAWARLVDHRLATGDADADALTDRDLWLNPGQVPDDRHAAADARTNIEFCGRVDDQTLDQLYRDAPCVVAPALDEDYGLTAIEAMRHGRPVVVCKDGGGLAELVDDGVNGLVVEPTGPAIADAVARLTADPDLAAELGANGRARAATLTWANADTELRDALDRVLA